MVTTEQRTRLVKAQQALGYSFKNEQTLLAAITHPSAIEDESLEHSYERLEFLGDSIVGAIVAREAFNRYRDLNEGGLTRIKIALVAGSTLSDVAQELGFDDIIIFGESERGTGKRGLHSALENVYEAVVAALFLDGGLKPTYAFIKRTLFPRMTKDLAAKPENPKSALQERLQEDGITPTYKLVETKGPPHDRTFITQVFAGVQSLARGVGRTKKESESKAADSALRLLDSADHDSKKAKAQAKAAQKAKRTQQRAEKAAAQKAEAQARAAQKAERTRQRAAQKAEAKEARKRTDRSKG